MNNEKPVLDDITTEESVPIVEHNSTVGDKSRTKSKKSKKTSDEPKRDSKARTASAAVFFNDNKSIAGFGNALRSVFTSIRELVENSLDASEKRGVIPNIYLKMRRLTKKELDKLMGTSVTVKTKEQKVDFIELSCRDNGVGVKRELIPQLFGTVLAGTKYGAQQTRGRFGLGSKMVLLHAMSTLDLPIQITTRPLGENVTYRVQLFIDLEKNKPIIHKEFSYVEGDENYFDEYGTEIKVSFTGSWSQAKNYIHQYFKQLAIITPYADIIANLPGDERGDEDIREFKRVVDELPNPPQVVKIHPWGTDISTFRREMTHSNDPTVKEFLMNQFDGVNEIAADTFFKVVGVNPETSLDELSSPEIRRIVHDGFNMALKESQDEPKKKNRIFKFDDPRGDVLSPLGMERLRKGLEKELEPDFVEAVTRNPRAYEGHPFIIEAAIGYGGGVNKAANSKGVTIKDNRIIYRYANRIPLIFGGGNDLITKVADSINWSDYGLTRGTENLAIAVSLVSTKIPFPETSKEYIDSVDEIAEEVRLVLMQLGRKLKTFLGRKRRRQRERQRKSRFEKFAPNTVDFLLQILEKEGKWNPITGINKSRIIAALSSGKRRIGSEIIPFGETLTHAPIWYTPDLIETIQNGGIYELSSFLRTPNKKLAKIMKWKEIKVDKLKRRTIDELENKGIIPEVDVELFIDPDIERRFHKKLVDTKIEITRLGKALNRRWIRNYYDFLVSPTDKLQFVQGLFFKLMEVEKYKILNNLTSVYEESSIMDDLSLALGVLSDERAPGLDSFFKEDGESDKDSIVETPVISIPQFQSTDTDLELIDVLPNIDDLLEIPKVKKRKVKSHYEFLLEIAHPTDPLDQKILALDLVIIFKEKLLRVISEKMELGNVRVDIVGQKWIDGYLRNAFKRRKISTITDVLNFKDEDLAEIGELQRTLFNETMSRIKPVVGENLDEKLLVQDAAVKIKILKKVGISTVEELLSKKSMELAEEPNMMKYFDLLIEEVKDKIIENLTLQNKLGELQLLKDIDEGLEAELMENQLFNTVDFLKTPLNRFSKKYHERIIFAKKAIGFSIDFLNKTQIKLLQKLDINVLEELVFHPDEYLTPKLSEEDRKTLTKLLDILMKPVQYMEGNFLSSSEILYDAGITTVGKFLVWPSSKLADILDYQEEWINLLKGNFDLSEVKTNEKLLKLDLREYENLLDETQVAVAEELGFITFSEVSQVKWGDIYPDYGKWSHINKFKSFITGNIDELIHLVAEDKNNEFLKVIANLEKNGYDTVISFLRANKTVTIAGMTKKNGQVLEQIYNELESGDLKYINPESIPYKAILFYNLMHAVRSPIVYLSEFQTREIEILNQVGIKTLHQVVSVTKNDLINVLHLSQSFNNGVIQEKLSKSLLNLIGTPLFVQVSKNVVRSVVSFKHEDFEYFQKDEINTLISAGYNTIEGLYYMSDSRTFSVPSIDWNVISHYKKLLQSPLVLITWRKEIKIPILDEEGKQTVDEANKPLFRVEYNYENFTSKELEKLNKRNVTRVIDFLTIDKETIQNIVNWDGEVAETRQTSVILQEAGIELSDLEIFRQDHVEHLRELGMITIEDLYFTAKDETWDSDIIPFSAIQTIKNVLHLDLINVIEELGSEMVELLKSNKVKSILDLYLTGDAILEQRTSLPAERFENLKFALDFGALIQVFDKSVYFTPGLTYAQKKKLQKNGFEKIIDIVLGRNEEIAELLGLQKAEIDFITEGINRNSVMKSETETGVHLKDILVFTRSEIRSISKSGIFEKNELDTLQEVLYQIDDSFFQGESYLLEQVVILKKVCNIKLSNIGDLNQSEVKLLLNEDIKTISDVLIVGYEDLPNNDELYNALRNITKSVTDLRPFVALGKLKAVSAMEVGEYEGSLLDAWLNNIEGIHSRVINSIRSLLSIPITFTNFMKNFEGELETLVDKTVGDVILEYYPDENSPEAKLKNEINEKGSLIQLLKEGSTPITLLELQPSELRVLIDHDITTIERLLTNDPKYLVSIAGNTQKFWSSIRDFFSPDVFSARLEDIGIQFDLLGISREQKQILTELDIQFLEELVFHEQIPEEISIYYKFLFSSTIFLIGTPGEKEFAENMGARNILEAVQAFRANGAINELVRETLQIAWSAYNNYAIPIDLKNADEIKVFTLQDLSSYLARGEKASKQLTEKVKLLNKSLLFLPLKSHTLKELVNEHRCSTILEAVTSPMVFGEISTIRTKLIEGDEVEVLNEIEVPIDILKSIDKTIWNRLENTEICLQDILSSPRTQNEFKGIKIRNIQQARDDLKLPINRLQIRDRQLFQGNKFTKKLIFVEDLLYNLPTIYMEDPQMALDYISSLSSPDINLIRPISIPDTIASSAVATFNVDIDNFQSLYSHSTVSAKMLKSIGTNSAITIRSYILKSLNSISVLDKITPRERWNLWKVGIRTVADLLLPKVDLGTYDFFTKKSVRNFTQIALDSLEQKLEDPLIKIRTILDAFSSKSSYRHDYTLANLLATNPHPLIADKISLVPDALITLFNSSIYNTELGVSLDFKQLVKMFENGIQTIGDFLFYPEELNLFSDDMNSVSYRLEQIKSMYKPVRRQISLKSLGIPEQIQVLLKTSDSTVIDLLNTIYSTSDVTIRSMLQILLQYTDFEEEQIVLLEKSNIKSTLDLLIAPPKQIATILDIELDEVAKMLEKINFAELRSTFSQIPLRIDSIEELSKNSINTLKELNFETLLDVSLPIEGLNKSDSNTLQQLISILDSDVSTIYSVDLYSDHDRELSAEFDHKIIRQLIRYNRKYDSQFKEWLRNITPSILIDAAERNRRLSDLDGIVVKEEKILNLGSIYRFDQLIYRDMEFFTNLGLQWETYSKIIGSLRQDYTMIVDLSEEIETEATKIGLETVAEALSNIELLKYEFTKPIKVKQEIILTHFFRDEKFKFLVEEKINNISKFLKSKKINQLLIDGSDGIIDVIGTLNLPVENLPDIKSKWVNQFYENKIYRIYQYLTTDLEELATITETSFTSQENFLNKLDLTNALNNLPFELPISGDRRTEFAQVGIVSLNSLIFPSLLEDHLQNYNGILQRINDLKKALKIPIWQSSEYWKLQEDLRILLANYGDSLLDFWQSTSTKLSTDEIQASLLKILESIESDQLVNNIEISSWINPEHLSKDEPDNLFAWLYQDYKETITQLNSRILRRSISIIPSLSVKQILKASSNGITHISDILFLSEDNLGAKIGITKTDVEKLKNDLQKLTITEEILPSISYFNDDQINKMREADIRLWAEFIGNIREDELARISGITDKTRSAFLEKINLPIWYIEDIRNIGMERMSKIVSSGCYTILEFLSIGSNISSILDEEELKLFYNNIDVKSINKGLKHHNTKLSISKKVKVSDMPEYEKVGIKDPIDIFLGKYNVKKDSELLEGIGDWKRLGELPIEDLVFKDESIVILKSNNLNTIADAILVSNTLLRDAKVSNPQIKEFRDKLNRKKASEKKKSSTKKTTVSKADETKKTTESSSKKKTTSKKSSTAKKTTTSKKSSTAKTEAKKVDTKKVTKKKSTKKKSTKAKK